LRTHRRRACHNLFGRPSVIPAHVCRTRPLLSGSRDRRFLSTKRPCAATGSHTRMAFHLPQGSIIFR
jgi:hypothetical protein